MREFLLVQSRANKVQPSTGGYTLPLIHSTPNVPSPLWLSIHQFPLQIYSDSGQLLGFDNRLYYGSGIIGKAVDLSCEKFQAHIIREMAMPEIFEAVDEFFFYEVAYIDGCITDAFNELGLISFEYKCFRIIHQKGIAYIVSNIQMCNKLY